MGIIVSKFPCTTAGVIGIRNFAYFAAEMDKQILLSITLLHIAGITRQNKLFWQY